MPKGRGVLANRSYVYEGFTIPVSEFYAILEEALAARTLPKMKIARVFLREGGLFGAKREYLRARRGRIAFDISAAYFGEGSLLISWWHRKLPLRRWLWILGFLLVLFNLDLVSEQLHQSVMNALGTCALFLFVPLITLGAVFYMARSLPGVDFLFEVVSKLFELLGELFEQLLHLPTFFQADTAAAFEALVPATVEGVAKELEKGQVLRGTGREETEALPAGG